MTGKEFRALMKISSDNGQKAVFAEYYNYVYTIVFNRSRSFASKEDIEECVSDVFAELFIRLDSGSSYIGDLTAYVNILARNKAVDLYRSINARKNIRSKISDAELEHLPDDTDIAGSAEKRETARIVLDIIEKLGEPDASIIILKYYYCRTSAEIGKKLSLSAFAVRKRAQRALKHLKKLMSENGITL